MKQSDITYVASCAFATVFSLAYSATMLFHIKLPRYYPLEHMWKMVNEKGVPSQGWYGMVGFAFVVGAALSVMLYMLIKRLAPSEAELRPSVVRLVAYASVVIVVGCMVYCALDEFLKWNVL